MHQPMGARRVRNFSFVVALLWLAALWPSLSMAATSSYCPTQSISVPKGGSVDLDVSNCDGPTDFGMAEPVAGFGAQHGSVTLSGSFAGVETATYAHNNDGATSDSFQLEDENGDTLTVNVTITAGGSITVSPGSLPAPVTGVAYSQMLTAAGGTAPYTFSSAGPLPGGLTLASDGTLSGTPSERGTYAFDVTVQDALSTTATKGYTGTVANPTLSMTPTVSGPAYQGTPYTKTLVASGGIAPYTYALETGPLPTGMTLSSAGVLSGTPTSAPGSYPLTVRVTDSSTGPGTYFEVENFAFTLLPPPTVTIAVAPASVSEDGSTNLVYTVTRSVDTGSPTTVNLTYSGTATAGTDYTGNVATLTIPAGATTATVTLDPTVDTTIEADETAIVTVAAGAGYVVGAPAAATGTITNDDVPTATISVSPASVTEDGATNLVYTVSLSSNPGITSYSINFNTAGTATSGTDYTTSVTSPLVIPAGILSQTIVVNPTADGTSEADETVQVSLAPGAGYIVGAQSTATGTITNDDIPTLSINDTAPMEGASGTSNAVFTVTLSSPAGPGGVTFDIATADGTATAGSDYVATSLTSQTIPAGSSSYTFFVPVNGDTVNEANETYFVNVTNVTNATVADGQGVGTITNDDAVPTVSVAPASWNEGNTVTQSQAVVVSLSAASGQTITVNYATSDGTATAPSDYVSKSGTLTFTPGQTSQPIGIGVVGDTTPEANETFNVTLSAPVNATLGTASAAMTIVNDDVPVSVGPATVPNATVGTAYSQTLTASGGTGPYAFAISAGALPAGLTLSSAGALSGTPTAGGTFNFTVTATDSSASPGPYTGARAYSLTVNAATVSLPAATLPGGTLGAAYSQAIGPASGGTAPYTYAVTSGAIPAGMTLASNGTLSGTPTAFGTFNFSVTATDSSTGTGPYTATQSYALTIVDQAPVANAVSLSVGFGASATPVTLSITGGAPTSVAVATAPAHGTATASGTTISYTPAAGYAGADSFTYTATNSGGTSAPATVSITIGNPTITVSAGGAMTATVGAPYSQTFTWSGGTAPYAGFQVVNLPAGMSVTGTSANSVTVSGTPTQAGSFNVDAQATDSSTGNGPYTASQTFALAVAGPSITLAPASGTLTANYGAAYSQSFAASGGVGPYSYNVTGALPAGVTLSGDTLAGTPTAPGSYTFTVTATDTGSTGVGAPFTASQTYTLQVAAPVITVTPATLPAATAASAYAQTLSAGGGVAPYTYSVSAGALPAGLTLSTSGQLSGAPTASGTFAFTARATDANGQFGEQAYSLTVAAPVLTLAPATVANGTAGTAYTQAFAVSGGIAPYTAVLTGTLPTGLTFDAASRTLSGTPTQSGTFTFDIAVHDSTAGTAGAVSGHYTLTIAAPTITLTPATVAAGTAGTAYSQTFSASGGIAPYHYAIAAGALPAGLALDANTGVLSGTPTVAGTFNFSVRATDSTTGTAASTTIAYTLTLSAPVITITPATLRAAIANTVYGETLSAAGGTAPYRFTITAGTLPTGVTLTTAGALSGTPSADGVFGFTITATDALGFTASRTYAVTVAPRPDPTRDAEVRGLLDAQAQATHRFASAQIDNFQARMESLHGLNAHGGMSNGLTFVDSSHCSADTSRDSMRDCGVQVERPGIGASDAGTGGGSDTGTGGSSSSANASSIGLWLGGAIRSGNSDGRAGASGLDFETDGVSIGADVRVSPSFVLGGGIGYGRDATDVGVHASRVEGESYAFVGYASYNPGGAFFIDSLVGYENLSYDLRRYVTVNGGMVNGSRDGSQWFGSIAAGADLMRGGWQFTPYTRVDIARADLDAYSEHGDAIYALDYGKQSVDTTTGNLGLRLQTRHATEWGAFSPLLRFEYQHDFQGDGQASMRYVDLPSAPLYTTSVAGFDRSRYMLGVGAVFVLHNDFSIRLEYRGLFGTGGDRDNALQLNFQKSY